MSLKLFTPIEMDSPVLALDGCADEREQARKDRVHELLNRNADFNRRTGCWLYLRSWDERGRPRVFVGSRTYSITRVAAWLYLPGFELWDVRWAVHTCNSPACFNFEHLKVYGGRAEALAALRAQGRWGSAGGRSKAQRSGRRLNYQAAAEVRRRFQEDPAATVDDEARRRGSSKKAIQDILDDRTWATGYGSGRKRSA